MTAEAGAAFSRPDHHGSISYRAARIASFATPGMWHCCALSDGPVRQMRRLKLWWTEIAPLVFRY
ncbi:MAG: hypothetical protein F4Y47_11395 [Acidobacteriia bacterium]|nr:hypothetical protein [Terriglobia bacterium]MYG03228.1 hypothetical protein [Terriglobia bacterium]MYK12279.1 hypothetical protein [Terriglobia bacterium]